MKKSIEKANVLIESLPYIQKFSGKTFVIKYGGSAMVDDKLKDAFALDIVLLNYIGIKTVIVHGGGPKINKIMEKMGKTPSFIHGQRVTDEETVDIVEMVLGGLINKQIVSLINNHGGLAIGLSGKDGKLIEAKRKIVKKLSPETGVPEIIDLGLVGEVIKINPKILDSIDESGFIPVIAPITAGQKSRTLNINADYVAGAIASALKAEKLVLLTDVEGIKDKKNKLIPTLNLKKIKALVSNKTIGGGFASRLMHNIREEKGLAYDIHSFFAAYKYGGRFQTGLQTKNGSANTAIKEVLNEIERIRNEAVSDSELLDAKSFLTGSFPMRIDMSRKIASFLIAVEYYGLGVDYIENYPGYINSVTKKDILRVAKKYLDPEKFILVVVANQQEAALKKEW